MPSVNKTTNLGLNQWAGNEYPKRLDFVEDNATIDAAVGKLANLTTDDKTNLVAALNEHETQINNLGTQFQKHVTLIQGVNIHTLTTAGDYIAVGATTSAADNVAVNLPNEAGYWSLTVKKTLTATDGEGNGLIFIATNRDTGNIYEKWEASSIFSAWRKILTTTDEANYVKYAGALNLGLSAGSTLGWYRIASGGHGQCLLKITETSYAEAETLLWVGAKYYNETSPALSILGKASYSSKVTAYRISTDANGWYLDMYVNDSTNIHNFNIKALLSDNNIAFASSLVLSDITSKTVRATVQASTTITMATSGYIATESGVKIGSKILDTAVRIQSATPTDTTSLWAW